MPERTNSADAQARYEDAAGVLMAISIVTRKLARKLLAISQKKGGEEDGKEDAC